MFPPDPELYPDYDKWLEKSMVLESTRFFDAVFAKNLSIREFLFSDWTVLNSRLAMHYGIRMPAKTILAPASLDLMIICSRLVCIISVEIPRRPSLPPSSIRTISG